MYPVFWEARIGRLLSMKKERKREKEILDAHLVNRVWHGLEIDGRGGDLLLGSLVAVGEAEKDRTGKIK